MDNLIMKALVMGLLLTGLHLTGLSQMFDVEKNKEKIRENNVKTQTKWKQNTKGENTKILTRQFDRQGNMIEEVNYKYSGEISSRLTYQYNEAGQKTEYKNYDVAKEKLNYHQIIEYGQNGQKIKERGFDGINNYKITYEYNSSLQLKEIIKTRQGGNIEEKWEYEHEGKKTRIKVLKGGNVLTNQIIEIRNPAGKLTEKTNLDPSGTELKKTIYEYNAQGNLIKEKEYYKGELSYTLYYSYDSKGNLMKIDKEEKEGEKYVNNSYTYDPENNLIKELWYEGNPDDYSKKTYNYDEEDNLKEVDSYYSVYKYKALYKYSYEFY